MDRSVEDEAAVVASKLPGPGAYGLADVKRQVGSLAASIAKCGNSPQN
jgi:hypothetical protein